MTRWPAPRSACTTFCMPGMYVAAPAEDHADALAVTITVAAGIEVNFLSILAL